jgi:hypothetical protein
LYIVQRMTPDRCCADILPSVYAGGRDVGCSKVVNPIQTKCGRGRAANASSGRFRPDHFNINSGRPLAFPAKQHHPPRPPLFYLYPPLLDPASIPPLSARAATDPTCYYFSAASFSACLWTTGRRAAGRKPPPPLFVFVSPVPCRSSKLCCRYRPPL